MSERLVRRAGTAIDLVENLRELGREIATGQRLPEILRVRGATLREQVEVLARVIELQYEAVDLVDQLRGAGELGTYGGDRRSSSGVRNLNDVGLDGRRLAQWRELRRLDALAFIRDAIDAGREDTLERVSLNWLADRLGRIKREEDAERRRQEPTEPITERDGITIRHGDFREVLDDIGPVDAIITDPPYPAEFLPLYDDLAKLGARVLPRGPLAAMVGQSHLPDVLARLGTRLTYRWCGAYLTEGAATRVQGRSVGTKWKPVLIFGGERFIIQDVFRSGALAGDKRYHHWGQSETGMAEIVERLTEPGDLVLDPFLGGGTTAIVCRDLERRFIGCDIDADAVKTARERVHATT